MRNRLPVYLENLELPQDEKMIKRDSNSYGYVSILYILSLIITGISVMVVLGLGK
ncbi:MAG: hypothetical protein ACI4WU_04610 [Bacilli bacterium]